MNTIIALVPQELATVLAALRYWQREGLMSSGQEQDIANNDGEIENPLDAPAIDDLCERINTEGDETGMLAALKTVVEQTTPFNDDGVICFVRRVAERAIASVEDEGV